MEVIWIVKRVSENKFSIHREDGEAPPQTTDESHLRGTLESHGFPEAECERVSRLNVGKELRLSIPLGKFRQI